MINVDSRRYGNEVYTDFRHLLEIFTQRRCGFKLVVALGMQENTQWGRCLHLFGESVVKYGVNNNTTRVHTTLRQVKDWNNKDEIFVFPTPRVEVCGAPQYEEPSLQTLEAFQHNVTSADEDKLATLWHGRLTSERLLRGSRTILWEECERRFGECRAPMTFEFVENKGIDFKLLKAEVLKLIQRKEWPQFLRDWHCRKLVIKKKPPASIESILGNVNRTQHGETCKCKEVHARLAQGGYAKSLPLINGHIFLIGREYEGPCKAVLHTPNMNVPGQSHRDRQRDFERAFKKLPSEFATKKEWDALQNTCLYPNGYKWNRPFVTSSQVYKLKGLLKGLVIGCIDKNLGEFSAVCPVLYKEAMDGIYSTSTGYEEICPKKCTPTMKKKHGEAVSSYVISSNKAGANQKGDEKHIMMGWKHTYKLLGWNKYASFQTNGAINTPYALFKMKNICDPEVRKVKWKSVRPIAPSTRHPMRTLLHRAGKAWHFISTQIPKRHFVINSTRDVPAMFDRVNRENKKGSEILVKVRDIEGCYPNMPKDVMLQAARDITRQMQDLHAREGVWVPRKGKRSCAWGVPPYLRSRYIWIPFVDLTRIMEFSLNHALIKMPNGTIKRQVLGIPMGDAISPGATICSCAWMEQEFLESISEEIQPFFHVSRYMDDVISIYNNLPKWDWESFDKTLEHECYVPPLTLEASTDGIFLENEFEIHNGRIEYRLKNTNTDMSAPRVWRYQHYNSYQPFARKQATICASLQKVRYFASNEAQLITSGVCKLREFIAAGYPFSVLRYCTNRMGAMHNSRVWRHILLESYNSNF